MKSAAILVTLSLGNLAFGLEDHLQVPFHISSDAEQILVADADIDGAQDLIVVTEESLVIYFQHDGTYDFDSGLNLTFPGAAIGWDLSTGYGEGISVVALVDGNEVLAWHLDQRALGEPESIATGLNGFITKGVNRLRFSRDINDDGRDDLIIPGAGVLNLYISEPDGNYQPPLEVRTETRMRTILSPGGLERRTGQSLTIPLMELRDVNQDGASDIVSRTETQLDVFLAQPDAARHFDLMPTYSVDIEAIEERLGGFDIDRLDFSNLTGILALTHEELLEDMDEDGIDDLVLREGGKVSLFRGAEDGMDLSQPDQVLRSSGNVLSVFLFDEDEDGLKDLWLWRVESISVGDIFVWLALSGSIAIEAFIYPNEGGSFSRRPNRRITVNLRFPSAIRLANQAMDILDEARAGEDQAIPPNVTANLDLEVDLQDLLVLNNNNLQVFLNTVVPTTSTDPFLDGLGYNREQDEYTLDIRDILANVSINGTENLDRAVASVPDFELSLDGEVNAGDVIPFELNGDGRDDVFVFTSRDNVQISGILLISRSAQ